MKGGSSTPAAHHIFDTSEDSTKPYQTDADIYIILCRSYYTYQNERAQT